LNINLKGTGFQFDENVKWISYGGERAHHSNIQISNDFTSVYGTCGGACGFCKPDPHIGLKLKIV
jgi:hypothetical protein